MAPRIQLVGDAAARSFEILRRAIIQYAKEWWPATDGFPHNRRLAMKPSELVSAFGTLRGKVDHAQRWEPQLRGPLAIMLLWLGKLGWTTVTASTFRDDAGDDINIVFGSPRLLQRVVLESARRHFFNTAVSKTIANNDWAGDSLTSIQRDGVWLEPIQKLVNSKKRSDKQKFFARAVHAGGVITDDVLNRWGY